MSNPFKAVGKVFKSVFKVVKKVAPFALAAAAVVFTGGAALGLTPTFAAAVGGVVTKLGLSVGLAGALTGAVTSAGFGAAIGGILGGRKGMEKGFLTGLLTGGVMGAVSPSSFGIVKGLNGAVTTSNAIAHGGNAFGAAGKGAFAVGRTADGLAYPVLKGAPSGMAPVAPVATGQTPTPGNGYTPPATGAPAPASTAGGLSPAPAAPLNTAGSAAPASAAATGGMAPAAAGGGGGIGGFLANNPLVVSNALQGIGGMLGKGDGQTYEDKAEAEERLANFAFKGAYTGSSDPFGMAGIVYSAPRARYYYDPQQKRVVDRQQEGQG